MTVKETNSIQLPSVSCLLELISVTRNLTSSFSDMFSGSFNMELVTLTGIYFVACFHHGTGLQSEGAGSKPSIHEYTCTCLFVELGLGLGHS